jgi:hypothetical protein
MAYGPNVEYPLETLLAGMSEKVWQTGKDRVRAARTPASKDARQVASAERLSQSGAKFADRRLGGLERRRAQPTRGTLLVCERAWLHASLKAEVYIPWGTSQLTDAQEAGATYEKYGPNGWSEVIRCPRPRKLPEIS